MTRQVTVGVIGAGRIGRLHAENLSRGALGAKVAGIADSSLAAAQAAAKSCQVDRAITDARELFADPAIEAIVICSPTDTHAPLLEAAAAAGKHIFCEKPIDLDLERTRQALGAVQRAGVLLQVGFNRRFDPDFARLARLVREGCAGTPEIVRITSRDSQPPPLDYVRGSGGLFLDMAIHDFDMARFLLREEVVEVHAWGANLVDPAIGAAGDVDTAVTTLRFPSGALCTIDNSRRAVYGYDQRLEVFGSKGCLVADHRAHTQVALWDERGRTLDRPLDFFLDRYRESYLAEMREFLDCVRDGRPPSVSAADGLAALRLALAARRSHVECRPVRMDEV
jgi:myo-inositol 2-dehydrogenase/D-chiro-inositol 1-dehydrogenase